MTRPLRGAEPPASRPRAFNDTARRMLHRLTPQRAMVVAIVALAVTGVALGVAGPLILGHATDLLFAGALGRGLPAGLTTEQAADAARDRGESTFADLLTAMDVVPGVGVDFGAVARTLAVALALYLLAALLVWGQARLLNLVVQRTVARLRSDAEDKIHRLPLVYFDTRRRGEVLSRVTNDVDNVATSLSMTISQLLTSVATVVAVLAMMVVISPLLAALTVVTVPLSLWATRTLARRSRTLFARQWADTGRLSANVEEAFSGFTVVKTYGHREAAQRDFAALNARVYHASFGAQFFSGLVSPATAFVGNLSYVAVAVVGGIQVATGQITLGNIQAFIQYVRQFNGPLTQVAAMYTTLQSGVASAERIFDLLDAEEEPASPTRRLPAHRQPPRVQFDHVSFSYRPGTTVIDDLSLVVEPGATVAIVGPTGAGKTTLVNLLMRFYDVDAGSIRLDGTDIADVDRRSLRSRCGMVLQDSWLFAGTIADNIRYGRPEAGDDEVVAAARAAHVDRFVATLPDGYDTAVADGGADLSAGERQLITIARAMIAQPALLILDEATSSVDTRTERAIATAMATLRRDRTTFVIAHRLSTIRDADMVLVLQDGRLVEQGSHRELLDRRGAYYAMTRV